MSVHRSVVLALPLVGVVSAACVITSERPERTDRRQSSSAAAAAPEVEAAEAVSTPGDPSLSFTEWSDGSVSIRTTNGALVMALRHDSVVMAFSDSLRDAVKAEVDKSTREARRIDSSASGLERAVRGVVQQTVSTAMREVFDKARGFPVSSLRDVRYERGAIRFDFERKPTWNFESMKTDGTPILEQFHPADAARFVGAVRARMGDR